MGLFKRLKKKPEEVDPSYTYYGDKNPTLIQQVSKLLEDPRFVGIERASTNTYKVTLRVWSGTSRRNLCYTETLERVMHWAGVTLERDKHAIR